ncbi:MAG: TonB-dependent receptor, partial [Epsilonproteobacteria bacterium]|nr:TonB-dependent receptor [Campylobacterota bacterium]
YDEYSQFENKTTGKIGFKYNSKILDKFSFNTNYGTAYNVPTLTYLYGAWGANPDLKPEDVNSFDIGAKYMGFKIGYFYNTINDMIVWEGAGYVNVTGTSILKGYEIGYNDFITDQLLTDISYTYLDAKDKEGNKLLRRPKDTIKYAFTYYATKNLDLTLSGEYIGERYDIGDVQTGKYTLANFVTNYKINKGLTSYIKADNLFDKKYQVVNGYATAERSFYVGLNFKIK